MVAVLFDATRVRALVLSRCDDWNEVRFNEALREYMRFLELCRLNPDAHVMAPSDVDEIWHMHMLDSVSYMRDCKQIFGGYLHHDPCLGPIDQESIKRTLVLYEATFGEVPPRDWLGMMTCAKPGGGCGSISPAIH